LKAIICKKYGSLNSVELNEVQKPVPGDNEVLVAVHASSINFNNLAHVKGSPFASRLWFGLLKPKYKIPGNDIAGQVELVGRNVKHFCPGDEVFGEIGRCGFGAFAEYVLVPENLITKKPPNLTFQEAAAVPEAAIVALQALRDKGQIMAGNKVLICGASGGIGTFAVQIAKSFGTEVTGVCSTRNLNMVLSIGADYVIDYTKEDFTKSKKRYDLIIATAGYRSIFDYRRALTSKGVYVVTGGAIAQIFQGIFLGPLISAIGSKKMGNCMAKPSQKDLNYIKAIIESGIVKPVIDKHYTLNEIAKALKYYGEGHAKGKVVITMRRAEG
jgi:NADPH:quinone reductase-like Zn-dependent oxidoreductase